MLREITKEEWNLLRSVGFADVGLDVSEMAEEFFADLIQLCRKTVNRRDTEKRLEQLEEKFNNFVSWSDSR